METDLEGSGHYLTEVQSRNVPGMSEENRELLNKLFGVLNEIRT